MAAYKIVLALISLVLTLGGYSFYFRDIFRGRTHPHAFTWLVWGTLTAIAFSGQLTHGGGAGSWVTGATAAVSFVLFAIALTPRGERNITRADKASLAGAAFAGALWALTSNATLAVIVVSCIDFLGFVPTIRKSFAKPYEETLIHYVFGGIKFVPAICALGIYSAVTVLYPASLVVANLLFAAMLVVRRRMILPPAGWVRTAAA